MADPTLVSDVFYSWPEAMDLGTEQATAQISGAMVEQILLRPAAPPWSCTTRSRAGCRSGSDNSFFYSRGTEVQPMKRGGPARIPVSLPWAWAFLNASLSSHWRNAASSRHTVCEA